MHPLSSNIKSASGSGDRYICYGPTVSAVFTTLLTPSIFLNESFVYFGLFDSHIEYCIQSNNAMSIPKVEDIT